MYSICIYLSINAPRCKIPFTRICAVYNNYLNIRFTAKTGSMFLTQTIINSLQITTIFEMKRTYGYTTHLDFLTLYGRPTLLDESKRIRDTRLGNLCRHYTIKTVNCIEGLLKN